MSAKYVVMVEVMVPVVFEGATTAFEKPTVAYADAAVNAVADELSVKLAKYANVRVLRNIGSERYYFDGVDYTGKAPEGMPVNAEDVKAG